MNVLGLTSHAARACSSRDIPADVVLDVVRRKLADRPTVDSVAVRVGRYAATRGALVGSNGDTVWAVVRGGVVTTVMLRRSDQPSTRAALRVDLVVAPAT